MKLKTIIENKIDSLYTTYEDLSSKNYETKLSNAKKDFALASEFLDDISKDINNLVQLETNVISHIVSESNWEMLDEQLKIIKLVYEARNNDIVIDLTEEQKEFLSKFIVSLQQRVEELNNLIGYFTNCLERTNHELEEIEKDIDDLDSILSKITNIDNKELLTNEDFAIISRIFIEDLGLNNTIKKNILKEYIKYNDSLITTKTKEVETINPDDFKKLLAEYKVDAKTIEKVDLFKKGIISKNTLDQIREILDYLVLNDELANKRNIVNSFKGSSLITVLLKGNIDSVRYSYNYQIENYGRILNMFLETPALWIPNIVGTKKGKKKKGETKPRDVNAVVDNEAHETSIGDLILNEEFLRGRGFNVSIASELNAKTLKTKHYNIVDNYEIYKLYGVLNEHDVSGFNISSLTFSNVLEHLDNLVEVGLLDDYLQTERVECSYTVSHSSIIQNATPEKILLLYRLKATMLLDEYYDFIFSKNKDGMLATTTLNTMMKNEGLNSKTINEHASRYFVNLESIIPGYNEYLECIYKANLIIHDDAILNDPLIDYLENNYKVTDYSYKFGNQTISRLKVLRNFTALRKFGFINEEALLFCITYNSYIDEETLNIVRGSLNLNGGSR